MKRVNNEISTFGVLLIHTSFQNIVVGLNKHLENEEDKTKKIEQLAKYLKER